MKKNFKATNPALAYISGGQEQEEREPVKQETEIQGEPAAETAEPQAVQEPGSEITPDTLKYKVPAGYRIALVETRSRRVQLLMQPSLFNRLSKFAKKSHISRNEAALLAISTFLGEEEKKVETERKK